MKTIASPQEFVTITQAAERLGVTSARVRQFREQGRFAGCVQIGPQWIIPAAEIERFSRLERPSHRPKFKPAKQIKKLRKSGSKRR